MSKYNYSESEKLLEKANNELHHAGWVYLGADYWQDPITVTKFTTSVAHKVLKQRAKREKILKSLKEPRLVGCDDWRGIRNELRRQLKPFGLTVTTRTNYKEWADGVQWEIKKRPDAEYEKLKKQMEAKSIDPWNPFL